jgi:hypothetical protein
MKYTHSVYFIAILRLYFQILIIFHPFIGLSFNRVTNLAVYRQFANFGNR